MNLIAELRRRNVLRAAVLYAGAVWALAQGVAQLAPVVNAPGWAPRAFLIAAAIGFPFWIAFAWFYEFAPKGPKDQEIDTGDSRARRTGRKLDFAIIAVLSVAVILLLGNQFLWRRGLVQAVPSRVSAQAKPEIPQKSVAVLPFTNEGGKPEERFFSDGLSEDLINALSQFDDLKVISRSSAFQFRDSNESSTAIGEKLGVAHLLEGAVQRLGDELRITATLVNAADGSILWSQRYDESSKDLFALQDAITQAVADALKAKLPNKSSGEVLQTDRPPSGNLDAFLAYQRGSAMSLNSEASFHNAIDAFNEAIRLDPEYAAAYAQLSIELTGLAIQFEFGSARATHTIAEARKAAQTALALDDKSSLAHQAKAYLLQQLDMDWIGAEIEARRALQLAPNYPTAQFGLGQASASLGRNRYAAQLTRQAITNNPRSADWYNYLSVYLTALDQLDDARKTMQVAIDLQPGAATYYEQITVIEILRGNAETALAAARKEPDGPWHDVAMALALQIGRDRAAADAAAQKLAEEHKEDAAYQIAQVYALRRDPENTFKWLDRAWSNRDPGISSLLSDPLILRYRNDPRFAAYCRKAGLPDTTDAATVK